MGGVNHPPFFIFLNFRKGTIMFTENQSQENPGQVSVQTNLYQEIGSLYVTAGNLKKVLDSAIARVGELEQQEKLLNNVVGQLKQEIDRLNNELNTYKMPTKPAQEVAVPQLPLGGEFKPAYTINS